MLNFPPSITSNRLILNDFSESDVPTLTSLLNDPDLSLKTENLPYPYTQQHAQSWILSHPQKLKEQNIKHFAIRLLHSNALIGNIELRCTPQHQRANIGYLIGKKYQNQGYATEALQTIIHFAFTHLNLNRIEAHHMSGNTPSQKVMQKSHMTHEATLHQYSQKNNSFLDAHLYAILKSDYLKNQ